AFRNSVLASADVKEMTVSSMVPGIANNFRTAIQAKGESNASVFTHQGFIDEYFSNLYGLKTVAGRIFSVHFTGDRNNIVINRRAAEDFGFKTPENAVGQKLILIGNQEATIVGVLENFSQLGLQFTFEP